LGASAVVGIVVLAVFAVDYQGVESMVGVYSTALCGLLVFIEIVLALLALPRLPALARIWRQARVLAPSLVVTGAACIAIAFTNIGTYVESSTGFQYHAVHPIWFPGALILWLTITNWPLRSRKAGDSDPA
jgi:glucan phosphoethanolaminetransferase (alkaline phosphatase superfamily)